MKNLQDIITEKLVIHKDSRNTSNLIDVSNVELQWKIKCIYGASSKKESQTTFNQMIIYADKNTKVTSLHKSNMNIWTLFDRWVSSILLEWDEAEEELRKELINKINYPNLNVNEQLNAYLYKWYTDQMVGSLSEKYGFWDDGEMLKDHLRKYLNKYHVKI